MKEWFVILVYQKLIKEVRINIVKSNKMFSVCNENYGIAEIGFENGSFVLFWLDDKEAFYEYINEHIKFLEVIGNKFKNTELLEGKR